MKDPVIGSVILKVLGIKEATGKELKAPLAQELRERCGIEATGKELKVDGVYQDDHGGALLKEATGKELKATSLTTS